MYKLGGHELLIISKYFISENDFINTNDVYNTYIKRNNMPSLNLFDMYRYNPIDNYKLFKNIETLHIYDKDIFNNTRIIELNKDKCKNVIFWFSINIEDEDKIKSEFNSKLKYITDN